MTTRGDAWWDELGVAWYAIDPDEQLIMPRLLARLRWQRRLGMAGFLGGGVLGLAGAALGLATVVAGWQAGIWHFVTRGVAVLVISLTIGVALISLRGAGARIDARPLSDMIALTIEGIIRVRRVLQAGMWSCLLAAGFGIAGTAIRSHLAAAPRMSPLVDLLLVALVAVVLALASRRKTTDLAKYRALQKAISPT